MRSFFQLLMRGAMWLCVVVLFIIAINLKSPYFFSWRSYQIFAILSAVGILGVFFYFKTRAVECIAGLLTLLTVCGITLWNEYSFQHHRSKVLTERSDIANRLGAHFIVGYEDVKALEPLVSRGLIGGIFITRRNIRDNAPETLRQEIAMLQSLRAQAGLDPLLVATDQEGGIVSRLSPPLEKMPPLSSVVEQNRSLAALAADAFAYGQRQGQGLAALGITVNFSPVVDLTPAHESSRLDFHSLINLRTISQDPQLTTAVGDAYVKGLQSQGIMATLKHFPGLGRVREDTHHFSAPLNVSPAVLQQSDWVPFKEISSKNNVLIMIGHVVLAEVDADNPASFSKPVIQDIIRRDWRHNGVLITDDLTMRAAYSHGFCRATVNALNAGVDLLLVSYDYEKFYDMMYCAMQAHEKGELDLNMLEQSRTRLNKLLHP